MPQIIGILLWALVPGFIARSKGRSFWGYFFLSLLITPLVTMIITLCLSNLKKLGSINSVQNENKQIRICKCAKCDTQREDNEEVCSVCGSTMKRFEYSESNNLPNYKYEECGNVGDSITDSSKCNNSLKTYLDKEIPLDSAEKSLLQNEDNQPDYVDKYSATNDNEKKSNDNTANTSIIERTSKFCRICGAKLIADSLFCSKCGTKVCTYVNKLDTK